MSKKKPSTIAGERLAEIQAAITAYEEREQALAAEVEGHQRKADAGDLDYDALRHIQAEAELKAVRRWLEVQRPHEDEAERVHQSFVLAEKIGDPHAQREAVESKRAATVEGIHSLLDEYAEAVTAYNSTLTAHIGTARRAGLIEEQADPTLPVLMGGGEYGHPRRLVVEGEHFVLLAADTDKIIQEARR
ncbi:hypothetical protein [Brachybacterium paraconglomeratum]|uniref:hypothetical protein n=1 Tax=Brachybacterium paraconglomeratum TaxID=173362 RepID=UPI003517DFEF